MDEIVEIKSGPELAAFLDLMRFIIQKDTGLFPVYSLQVGIDVDGLKVRANNTSWSRPFGRKIEA